MRNKGILSCGFGLLLAVVRAAGAEGFPPEFPFVISYGGATNATSVEGFLDAPAGGHGFVRVKDGHFATDAGAIRFNATGLTGPACFPSHAAADRLAARLSRLGVNCVRLHFMDTWYGNFMTTRQQGILADDTLTQRKLDPAQLDKLDYLVAALKAKGVYVDLNTHVGRTLDHRDGCPDGGPWANKSVCHFMPRLIELQREYARDLLTHVNPYTGRAYAEEPAVAIIEISNEDPSLVNEWKVGAIGGYPAAYRAELTRQWNEWLHRAYATRDALRQAWIPPGEPLHGEQLAGTAGWATEAGGAQAEFLRQTNALSVKVVRTDKARVFFPKAIHRVAVKAGQTYTFSMKARRRSGAGIISCALASTSDGWREIGWREILTVTPVWQTFTRSFSVTETCPDAILQLTQFKPGDYELAALSFQAGAPKPAGDPTEGFEGNAIAFPRLAGNIPAAEKADFEKFLNETEAAYYVGLCDYFHRELKVRQPVSGTQTSYSTTNIQAQLDYVDGHAYWHHPHATGSGAPGWIVVGCTNGWLGGGCSMVNSLGTLVGLEKARAPGKPYTVSEYSHPYPNPFCGEGQPMACAVARLLDWDGIFQYSYNHYPQAFEPEAMPWCIFDGLANPGILAHFPVCSALLVRGDLTPERGAAIFVTKPGRTFTSASGELVWNRERAARAYLAVSTPNSKLFTGFPEGRTVALGTVTLTVGQTRLGWATVSLVSRRATGFGESGAASILLAATGDCGNAGRVIERVSAGDVRLVDRGHAPVEAEGIPAAVTLPAAPARVRCYALGPDGGRLSPVPVAASGTGSRLEIGPRYRTVWYEIEIAGDAR